MSYYIKHTSKKYGIDFAPMTQHVTGKQTSDEYINELIEFLIKEIIIDRGFDKENAIKLLEQTTKRIINVTLGR